jgi:hypothetical protein
MSQNPSKEAGSIQDLFAGALTRSQGMGLIAAML